MSDSLKYHHLNSINAELAECINELNGIRNGSSILCAAVGVDSAVGDVTALFMHWEEAFSNPLGAYRPIEFRGTKTSVFVTGFSRDLDENEKPTEDGLFTLYFYVQFKSGLPSKPVGCKIFKDVNGCYSYSTRRGSLYPILRLTQLQLLLVYHAGPRLS